MGTGCRRKENGAYRVKERLYARWRHDMDGADWINEEIHNTIRKGGTAVSCTLKSLQISVANMKGTPPVAV